MMYDIAGIKMDFNYDFKHSTKWLNEYKTEFTGAPDCMVLFRGYHTVSLPEGKLIKNKGFCWCITPEGDGSIIIYNPANTEQDDILCRFDFDNKWSVVNVSYIKRIHGVQVALIRYLGNLILRHVILKHKGIIFHSSAIKWNNYGIAFTAPSGTGKSTHAGLWKKLYGATILNDDSPAIKITEDSVTVYGTPWSGSNKIDINDSAHLDMIVILEQAKENVIEKVDKGMCLSRLMPRFLLPINHDEMMDMAFCNINRIIELTPIYLLKCRPEKEAVDLVLERLSTIC